MRSTTCQLIFGLLSLKLYLTVNTLFDNRIHIILLKELSHLDVFHLYFSISWFKLLQFSMFVE